MLKEKNQDEEKNQELEVIAKDDKQKIKLPPFISIESAIGVATMLATRSQQHKYLFATDFEWLIMPAIMLKQFKIFRTQKNEPIAMVSWAKITEEIENRLLSGTIKLAPKEWNNGDRLWIINLIAPFGGTKKILQQLNETEFKNSPIKLLQPKKDGTGLEGKLLTDVLNELD